MTQPGAHPMYLGDENIIDLMPVVSIQIGSFVNTEEHIPVCLTIWCNHCHKYHMQWWPASASNPEQDVGAQLQGISSNLPELINKLYAEAHSPLTTFIEGLMGIGEHD